MNERHLTRYLFTFIKYFCGGLCTVSYFLYACLVFVRIKVMFAFLTVSRTHYKDNEEMGLLKYWISHLQNEEVGWIRWYQMLFPTLREIHSYQRRWGPPHPQLIFAASGLSFQTKWSQLPLLAPIRVGTSTHCRIITYAYHYYFLY